MIKIRIFRSNIICWIVVSLRVVRLEYLTSRDVFMKPFLCFGPLSFGVLSQRVRIIILILLMKRGINTNQPILHLHGLYFLSELGNFIIILSLDEIILHLQSLVLFLLLYFELLLHDFFFHIGVQLGLLFDCWSLGNHDISNVYHLVVFFFFVVTN